MTRRVDLDREKDIEYVMKLAIDKGIKSIYRTHPIFQGSEKLLLDHINYDSLRNKAEEIYSELVQNKIYGERARKYIETELTDYVNSGNFFDEKGTEIIGIGAIKEKPNLLEKMTSFLRGSSGGQEELNKTMQTLHDLYLFYKSGEYDKKIPELNESFDKVEQYLTRLEKGNFVPAMANILESYGKIDKRTADHWRKSSQRHKRDVKEGEEHIKEIKKSIESYVSPQKVAAAIIGGIGMLLMLFNLQITGAVIGENSTLSAGIIGVAMILFASLLYLRPLKKGFKK